MQITSDESRSPVCFGSDLMDMFAFSVKNIGSRLHSEINKKLSGGYNILLKFVFNDHPMQIINATLIGGCIIGL